MQQNAYWIFHLTYFYVPSLTDADTWCWWSEAPTDCSMVWGAESVIDEAIDQWQNGWTPAWKLMDDTLSTCCDWMSITSIFIFYLHSDLTVKLVNWHCYLILILIIVNVGQILFSFLRGTVGTQKYARWNIQYAVCCIGSCVFYNCIEWVETVQFLTVILL